MEEDDAVQYQEHYILLGSLHTTLASPVDDDDQLASDLKEALTTILEQENDDTSTSTSAGPGVSASRIDG